jgi:hypothetical protein
MANSRKTTGNSIYSLNVALRSTHYDHVLYDGEKVTHVYMRRDGSGTSLYIRVQGKTDAYKARLDTLDELIKQLTH